MNKEDDVVLKDFFNSDLLMKYNFPIITVYYNTSDYPNEWLARLFRMNIPTNYIVISNDLKDLTSKIPSYMVRLEPQKNDDPVIKGIFI